MKYWSDLGKVRVGRGCLVQFLGDSSPAHQLQLYKGWLLSLLAAASGCRSVWKESSSSNRHLNPSVTESAPWQLKFSGNLQPCSVCARRGGWMEAALQPPGQGNYVTGDRSSPLKYLTSSGRDRKALGGFFLWCKCGIVVSCALGLPLGRAPRSVLRDDLFVVIILAWSCLPGWGSHSPISPLHLFLCHPVYVLLGLLYFCFEQISSFTSFRSFL